MNLIWENGIILPLYLKDGLKQMSIKNAEIESKWWNAVIELIGYEQRP